jgi:hypothetical protein
MVDQSLDAVPTAPRVGDLAQDAQLANVVGIVVGHDQDLPQDGVLVVARDRAEEVGPVIGHDANDRLQVALECRDALVLHLLRRPRVQGRPIVPRPGGRLVVSRRQVGQDVGLRHPEMLDQMPEGVGDPWRPGIDLRLRELGNRLGKGHVRVAAAQHVDEVIS